MEADYWRQRWREGRIGFHQEQVTPLLREHWPGLGLAAGERVFVPLAGKSLDLAWLAAQGHRVLGVELVQAAVEQFFDEHGLAPERHESRYGLHYRAGPIELVCGDVFALDAQALADCGAVYDRAALIALPPALRQRYAHELYAQLPQGCRGLLIALEYPPAQKAGPPFPVDRDEVERLFARDWSIGQLDRRDVLASQPGLVAEGVTSLHNVAYRLQRR